MDFDDYAEEAKKTAVYPGSGEFIGLAYAALGLTGEAGEVAEKVKKLLRDNGRRDTNFNEELAKELGDVLWYCAAVAEEIGYDLNTIALINVAKLKGRHARSKLSGSGDNR
jgi:NTP pyrophosphatase (non-canonical NTP hydrolase)